MSKSPLHFLSDRPSFLPVPPSIQSPITPYRTKESTTGTEGQSIELCLSCAVFFICIYLTLLHPSLGIYSAPLYGSLPLAQTHPWSNSSNNLTSDPLPFFGPLTPQQHQQGLRRPPIRSEHTTCVCMCVCFAVLQYRLLFNTYIYMKLSELPEKRSHSYKNVNEFM